MKSTGVIRRIDELGRIVIPKEIRKTLRIHDGDNLEIYTDNEENIILSKYSRIGAINDFSNTFINTLQKFISCDVIITDKDKIIALSNNLKKKYENKEISKELIKYLEKRETINKDEFVNIKITNNDNLEGYFYISPIIVDSDSIGLVILYSTENIKEFDTKISQFINLFFTKYLEE